MGSHDICSVFASHTVSACLPEQFTAVGVILVIDCFLQNTAEMQGKPAESEDQHEAEHRLRHFPPLHTQRQILMLLSASVFVLQLVTAVQWSSAAVICLYTCFMWSFSAMRMPFLRLSISQDMSVQKIPVQASGRQKQKPNSHQSFTSWQNWNKKETQSNVTQQNIHCMFLRDFLTELQDFLWTKTSLNFNLVLLYFYKNVLVWIEFREMLVHFQNFKLGVNTLNQVETCFGFGPFVVLFALLENLILGELSTVYQFTQVEKTVLLKVVHQLRLNYVFVLMTLSSIH